MRHILSIELMFRSLQAYPMESLDDRDSMSQLSTLKSFLQAITCQQTRQELVKLGLVNSCAVVPHRGIAKFLTMNLLSACNMHVLQGHAESDLQACLLIRLDVDKASSVRQMTC